MYFWVGRIYSYSSRFNGNSNFRLLLHRICEDLDLNECVRMTKTLPTRYERELSALHTNRYLFRYLEGKAMISQHNLTRLITMLTHINREDLVEEINIHNADPGIVDFLINVYTVYRYCNKF